MLLGSYFKNECSHSAKRLAEACQVRRHRTLGRCEHVEAITKEMGIGSRGSPLLLAREGMSAGKTNIGQGCRRCSANRYLCTSGIGHQRVRLDVSSGGAKRLHNAL